MSIVTETLVILKEVEVSLSKLEAPDEARILQHALYRKGKNDRPTWASGTGESANQSGPEVSPGPHCFFGIDLDCKLCRGRVARC